MNTFNYRHEMQNGDNIFASLVCNGRTIVNINASNFGCIDEVMRYVIDRAGTWMGLARVKVRNASQGWSADMPITTPRPRLSIN